jgi:hypothetical protein
VIHLTAGCGGAWLMRLGDTYPRIASKDMTCISTAVNPGGFGVDGIVLAYLMWRESVSA